MSKSVEIIPLHRNVPGVGPAGAFVVHDPHHPDPRFRLAVVDPRDEGELPLILEMIKRASRLEALGQDGEEGEGSSRLRAI